MIMFPRVYVVNIESNSERAIICLSKQTTFLFSVGDIFPINHTKQKSGLENNIGAKTTAETYNYNSMQYNYYSNYRYSTTITTILQLREKGIDIINGSL